MATFAVLQVAVLGGFPSGRTPGIEEIGLRCGVREDLSPCAQQMSATGVFRPSYVTRCREQRSWLPPRGMSDSAVEYDETDSPEGRWRCVRNIRRRR
jgi:hypothetical protein